jgi:hypothetical protein
MAMARDLENYVTFYGASEEAYRAMKEVVILYERLNGHDGPEMLEDWRIGTESAVFRLDPFETSHWESPKEYISELSHKYPNVVIEWSYFCLGNEHGFYSCIFKNGHSLAEMVKYPIGKRSGRKMAEKSYYRKALSLIELVDAS